MNDYDQWRLDRALGEDLPDEPHDAGCPMADDLGGPCSCEPTAVPDVA